MKIYCKKSYYIEKERYNFIYNKLYDPCTSKFDDIIKWMHDNLYRWVRIMFGLPLLIIFLLFLIMLYPFSFYNKKIFNKGEWYECEDWIDYVTVTNDDRVYEFSKIKRKWYLFYNKSNTIGSYFIMSNTELRKIKLKKLGI